MIDKAYVIKLLRPNSSFALINNKIEWHDSEQTQPTEIEINNKTLELQTAYDAKQYQRDRAAEYPSMADQLDDIYHNGIDAWKATIKTTKDKYPK